MNDFLLQGSFEAQGIGSTAVIAQKVIPASINPDWVHVYNYSQYGPGPTATYGVEYYWQKGMPSGSALAKYYIAGSPTVFNSYLMTAGGIYITDTSNQTPETAKALATTFVSKAQPALVTTAAPHGYKTGDIVRMYGTTTMLQIASMDFVIDVASATTFHLTNLDTNLSNFTQATAGWTERVNDLTFYPRWRYITAFLAVAGSSTDVRITMSVTHNYGIGQILRIKMPTVWGATNFDEKVGTIVAVGNADAAGFVNTVDVRFDSNSISTAFAFPVSSKIPFNFAMVVPAGEDLATALNANVSPLVPAEADMTAVNIVLGTGIASTITGPAGSVGKYTTTAGDIMYWRAGRSYSNN